MAQDQRQIEASEARARDETRLRRLIWLREKPEGVLDNALVASLRTLEANGGRLLEGDRLVEESSERFIELMLRMLFPNDAVTTPAAAPIYLLVDSDDKPTANELILPALRSRGLHCRQRRQGQCELTKTQGRAPGSERALRAGDEYPPMAI